MLLSVVPVFEITAYADELTTGSCGDNVTYSFDADTGTITIFGTGPMKNFSLFNTPFRSNKSITNVVIEDGVTSIGSFSFVSCTNLTEVTLPNSITGIGNNSFSGCSSIELVKYAGNADSWNRISNNISSTGLSDGIVSFSISTEGQLTDNISYTLNTENGLLYLNGSGEIPNYYTNSPFYHCLEIKEVQISEGITRIGNGTFSFCGRIEDIHLPNRLISIGHNAFEECKAIKSIILNDNLQYIGSESFKNCSGLTSLDIPQSVISIFYDSFDGCSVLESINVDSGNAVYSSIDGILFNDNGTRLVLYPQGKTAESYTIQNGVKTVGSNAFWGCEHLKEVITPSTLTTLNSRAFYNCTTLENIELKNGLESIGDYAFYGCNSLTNISIPNGVSKINNYTFYNCSSLEQIIIPDSIVSIGSSAFYGCSSLTTVNIPRSVNSIGTSAFYNCLSLQSISIPDGVTSLENSIFGNCSSLTNVEIPASVVTIGQNIFSKCTSLTEVVIPEGVESLAYGVFFNCTGLTNIVIPDTVVSIANSVFYGCTNLRSASLSENITNIGQCLFYNCNNLETVNIPNNVTHIYYSAFYNCESLTNISLPESLEFIAYRAFYGCTGLTSIVIPNNTTSVGENTFYGCSNLTKITIKNKDCEISNSEGTIPQNAQIHGHFVSTAKEYADNYSREFYSICDEYYEETERVEPTSFAVNGYKKNTCSICGNEKKDALICYETDADSVRFASQDYILPVAKSFVYNGKLYARFDKPIANFNYNWDGNFKFAEIPSVDVLEHIRSLAYAAPLGYYVLGGIRSGDNWIWQYSGETISSDVLQWQPGQPDNAGNNENQLSIIPSTGLMNDLPVSGTTFGFIVSTDLNIVPNNKGYYLTNKYVYYNDPFPFSYAKQFCKAKNGHLASVTSAAENTAIYDIVGYDYTHGNTSSRYKYFIGGEKDTDGNYKWLNGETFSYTNWSSSNPDNYSPCNGQYYIAVLSSGQWDDCDDLTSSKGKETSGFVCEYEPTSLSVRIDQDSTHSVADSEIHILANYPDGTSNDITDIATFTKAYVDGCCRISAAATKPNGEAIKCTQDIPVEGEHTYVRQTVTNATCTKDGKVANICSICKSRYDEVVPETGHSYTVSKRVEPTCTESGYVQYTCSVCGDKYRETLDSLGHAFEAEPETVEATCTEPGTITYICSRCGETQVETIESQGHQYVISETIEATCTQAGYKTYICSVCGDTYNETTEAAKGHSYVSNTVSPTCTERGYTEYTCSACGLSYQSNYTDALGHNFETYVFNNDATDLFDGTETAQCTRCDATDTRNVETTTVYSDSISAVAGSEISVPVRIKNNSGVMGFALEFEYDSTVLTPVSVEKGSLITSGLDDNIQGDAVPGKFKVVWYGTENLTDNGILLYLNFTVSDRASGNTTIGVNYIQDDTFNESFEDVVLTCEDIDISITNSSSTTWYQGTLTPSTNEVTAGATFCVSIDGNGSSSELTNASQTISFDNTAFTFLGYADANQHLVQTSVVSSTGEITLITNNGHTYNVRTPGEVFDTIGIKYLLFKANDYANSGTYSFGYSISGTTVFEDVSAVGCNIKINASATSEVANIYIENGLSGEYTDTVTVPVYISNNKGVMGYMINFEYNPDELEIVLAQRGSSFPGNFNDTIGIDDEGTFSVLWSGNDAVTADGILMNLTFRVLTDEYVVSPITITYSQDDTFNSDYDDVVFNCISGSIHLNEEESHQFIDEVVAPTPNSKGYTKHTCTNCGYSYTDNEIDYANDMSALEAALEKVTGYDSADYSTSSYQQLQSVYSSYLDYPNRSIPQTTIDNATSEILTAISNLVPYLYLTVTGENGTVSVSGYEQADKYSVLFGETITLTATADEGYVFDGWYETVTKRIRSNDETFSFKITSNTDFEARFVKVNSATLTFDNGNGWIAGTVDKTVTEWASVNTIDSLLPKVPYKLGYTNGRWVYDNADVLSKLRNGENVTITPEYDETGYASPVAPTPLSDKPALDLYYNYDSVGRVASFTMAAGVPSGCRIESIGIALYYQKASEFDPTDFELNINNEMTTSKFDASNDDGIYTVDVNGFTSYYNWSARGYVTYYDKDGNLKTEYSNQINVVDRQQV